MIRTSLLTVSILTFNPVSAISVNAIWIEPSACGTPTGMIDIHVNGGVPPFSYLWSNGATTEDISGLLPGLYEVTVTDANSAQVSNNWIIEETGLTSPGSAQDGHASCVGASGGEVRVIEWAINGTPPYNYSPSPGDIDPEGYPVFYFPFSPPGTEVQIQVSDANGCTGTLTETIVSPQMNSDPQMVVSNIQGSCSGGAGGAATITNIYDGLFWEQPAYWLLDASELSAGSLSLVPNGVTVTNLPPGAYHFVRIWDPNYMAILCDGNPFDRVDFTIPDLGPDCGSVSGDVFIDNDDDCVQDGAEVGVPFQVLEILPGPSYAITGSDGHYAFDIPDGSYTLGQTDPTLVQLCPVAAPLPFAIASNQVAIDLADSSTVPLDLIAELGSGPMRPGFSGTFWGRVRNVSPQVSGVVTVTMEVEDVLVYVSAAPPPTNVAGNIITWELPAFTAYQQQSFSVTVQVPVGTAIGTPLSSTLSVSNTLPEGGTGSNQATLNNMVTGSFDPNIKTTRTSSGYSDTQYFIGLDDRIEYTVHFQNTGTDTAFTVVVTDTLSEALDMSGFQQGPASHPFNVAFKPGRVVEWTFTDILLPDSNVNEAASHGMVSFSIRPTSPLLAGTLIENIANIYFDFNPPVITEPSVLVAEFSTGFHQQSQDAMRLQPNPANDVLRISSSTSIASLRVISADGRELMASGAQATNAEVNVSGLKAGAYLILATFEDGTEARERFIKH